MQSVTTLQAACIIAMPRLMVSDTESSILKITVCITVS